MQNQWFCKTACAQKLPNAETFKNRYENRLGNRRFWKIPAVQKASEAYGESMILQNRGRAKAAERKDLQNRYENRPEKESRILKNPAVEKASETNGKPMISPFVLAAFSTAGFCQNPWSFPGLFS